MSTFRTIIEQWPSRGEFAADIGATPQAVTNMLARNAIPSRYWSSVVLSASARGIEGVNLQTLAKIAEAKGAGVAA